MVTQSITTIDPYNADPAKWYCHEIIYQWKFNSLFLNQGRYADRHNEIFSFPSIKIMNNWVEKWLGHYLHIAVTSWWAQWYLKSPASRLFTQPFIFRCRSKLRVTGLCEGNSPVTGEFLSQRASNARSISIWLRHHGPSSRLTWKVNTCIFIWLAIFEIPSRICCYILHSLLYVLTLKSAAGFREILTAILYDAIFHRQKNPNKIIYN